MNSKIMEQLAKLYDGDVERVGFILLGDEIVEVENVANKPELGFDVSAEDIIEYAEIAKATWHTHPNTTSNLSVGDYETFLNWPEMEHFIIGNDGVSRYIVEDGELLVA